MIEEKTKCVVKATPESGYGADLKNQIVTATGTVGKKNPESQAFLTTLGGWIYGNGDTGFIVEPVKP